MHTISPCIALLASFFFLSPLFAADPSEPKPRFDPVQLKIEGWTVHVEPTLLKGEHAEEGDQALKMLGNHLQRISVLVPKDRLVDLKKLEIWVEHKHPELVPMQYHPGLDWLTERGYDPRLVKKVHVPQASALFSKQQMLKHPMVILHELSHAYHDQILGFDRQDIIDAYNAAKEAGSYEKVMLFTGKRVKHYGLTNHKEYFAEGTEAFFYRNDFYPFVAAELAEHDPKLYAVLVDIWGGLR